MDPRIVSHLAGLLGQRFTNPASQHSQGRISRAVLEDSRDGLLAVLKARTLGMRSDRVVFTSGGTESNNLALCGLVANRPGMLVVSSIEHPSVLAMAQKLQSSGRQVRYLPCRKDGRVDLEPLSDWIVENQSIALVSVMLANNETGVLQPLDELVQLCRPAGIVVHTDAVQAVGKIPVDFEALDVDAMTLTAHKIHGPVGVGGLLMKHDVKLEPQLYGGFQQQSLRPGTESPALASTLAFTCELAIGNQEVRYRKMLQCRELLEGELVTRIPGALVLGSTSPRLPHTPSISFPGLDRQILQLALDREGIACGTGSACASGSSQPSHVLEAMGLPDDVVRGAIRLSLSWESTIEEMQIACEKIIGVVERLRR